MLINVSCWCEARKLFNRGVNRVYSDESILEGARRDVSRVSKVTFGSENFNILTLWKGANSNFFNINISESIVQKFSQRRKLLARTDCIFLYSETESFIKETAASNSVAIRNWLSIEYQDKFIDVYDEVNYELINFINSLDSHLDQVVHNLYLQAFFSYLRFPQCSDFLVPSAFRPRPSDLIDPVKIMPVPYVPRIFESGSLIYSNEHSRQRQTGIVRIFENRAAALSRDVIIFGSSDSYSGFVPFLTAQFKRVFFVWSDTDDGLEYLHSSNVQPDDNAISIVAFRERFI